MKIGVIDNPPVALSIIEYITLSVVEHIFLMLLNGGLQCMKTERALSISNKYSSRVIYGMCF